MLKQPRCLWNTGQVPKDLFPQLNIRQISNPAQPKLEREDGGSKGLLHGRRAGFSNYRGAQHPLNIGEATPGKDQSPHRAEIYEVWYAMHKACRIEIVSGSMNVVSQIQKLMIGETLVPNLHLQRPLGWNPR